MSNQAILRITRVRQSLEHNDEKIAKQLREPSADSFQEFNGIQRNSDLSIAVACNDVDVRNVKAIIVGPPGTPYEFGFFEFAVKFPKDYPDKAPSVTATTTNNGRCRFNPNIYSQGKVCLSILGTWRGERGEQWSSAQGLESILISIQSLMSANPYENEPGYENAKTPTDKTNQAHYVAKIRHETLRISILTRMEGYLSIFSDGTVAEPPSLEPLSTVDMDEDKEEAAPMFEPFKDLCKRRFLWYYESYRNSIDEGCKNTKVAQPFVTMPFEGGGNSMHGAFNYPDLRRRLLIVKTVLDRETARWAEEGLVLLRRDHKLAAQLQRQFQQIGELLRKNDSVTLDLTLARTPEPQSNGASKASGKTATNSSSASDSKHSTASPSEVENPFVWILTYFGRPMTHLDGGMFQIRMALSPRFPDEQPRVTVETPLFHHRVALDGTLCYFPTRPDDLHSHIEAIVDAIEEEHPPYDPRTLVNLEAGRLFWGSADDKKTYNRQLRRAVQRSMDG